MKLNKLAACALAAPGFITLCAMAESAHAGSIPGAPVLAPVAVNGVVEISLADYAQALTAPGTKQLGPMFIPDDPGFATQACTAAGFCNYGVGVISATLGVDPKVLLGATPANNGGGDSSLDMSYQVEYFDPGASPGATVPAMVLVSDSIVPPGLSAAAAAVALMTVSGINGTVYLGYDCEAGAAAAFGCGATPHAPFADQAVTLVANTVYDVDLSLMIYAHDPVQASIDPRFSAPATAGGEFVFSPGITSGVPEPATWAAMLIGFGGVGAAMRRSRRGRPEARGAV